jgi:hypothetical protein
MFPHPFGVVTCEQGLSVSYPGAAIVAAESAIMGGGVSAKGDVVIGLKDAKFDDAKLADFSDWFVTAQFFGPSEYFVGLLKFSVRFHVRRNDGRHRTLPAHSRPEDALVGSHREA